MHFFRVFYAAKIHFFRKSSKGFLHFFKENEQAVARDDFPRHGLF